RLRHRYAVPFFVPAPRRSLSWPDSGRTANSEMRPASATALVVMMIDLVQGNRGSDREPVKHFDAIVHYIYGAFGTKLRAKQVAKLPIAIRRKGDVMKVVLSPLSSRSGATALVSALIGLAILYPGCNRRKPALSVGGSFAQASPTPQVTKSSDFPPHLPTEVLTLPDKKVPTSTFDSISVGGAAAASITARVAGPPTVAATPTASKSVEAFDTSSASRGAHNCSSGLRQNGSQPPIPTSASTPAPFATAEASH